MDNASISQFWDKYIAISKLYKVRDAALRWYVRAAENYIKAHEGLSLQQHGPAQLENYLREKGRNPNLESWQFKQMLHALEILFVEMVKAPWAKSYPWQDWAATAETLPTDHATLDRAYRPIPAEPPISPPATESAAPSSDDHDGQLSRQVYSEFPQHVNAMITQIRVMQYSFRTEQSYVGWLYRYIGFHAMQDPADLNESHIATFIEHLVTRRNVAASTQAQALNALVFFYRKVLRREISERIDFVRSKKQRRLPVVLTQSEASRLFRQIQNPTHKLMAHLLYGSGLRLMECVRLRMLDVDFGYRQILVRNTKGKKIGWCRSLTLCGNRYSTRWRMRGNCIPKTWRGVLVGSFCRMGCHGNIQLRSRSSAGNICFRRRVCRLTRVPGRYAATICTKTACRRA